MKPKCFCQFVIIFCMATMSCKEEKKQYEISDYQKMTDSLLIKSVNEGSRNAYNQLAYELLIAGDDIKYFYYSYLIATKYEYPEAYFDLYQSIRTDNNISSNKVKYKMFGSQSEVFRYYFLLKAFELAKPNEEVYLSIKRNIDEKFGKGGIIPSSKDFLVKNLK